MPRIDYPSIRSDQRIHISKKHWGGWKNVQWFPLDVGKPWGLWYATGTAWIDFCRSEMPSWLYRHVFAFEVDTTRVLKIDSVRAFDHFCSQYRNQKGDSWSAIDWGAVRADHYGIEISPYRHDRRMSGKCRWYYGWDVASGCLWDKRALLGVETLSGNGSGPAT